VSFFPRRLEEGRSFEVTQKDSLENSRRRYDGGKGSRDPTAQIWISSSPALTGSMLNYCSKNNEVRKLFYETKESALLKNWCTGSVAGAILSLSNAMRGGSYLIRQGTGGFLSNCMRKSATVLKTRTVAENSTVSKITTVEESITVPFPILRYTIGEFFFRIRF